MFVFTPPSASFVDSLTIVEAPTVAPGFPGNNQFWSAMLGINVAPQWTFALGHGPYVSALDAGYEFHFVDHLLSVAHWASL